MKLLIAVKSCLREYKSGAHEAIFDSWGKHICGLKDVRLEYFVGRRLAIGAVSLHCDDDYNSLGLKAKEILRWSVAKGYDGTLIVDTDTFLHPFQFLKTGFQSCDYLGTLLFNNLIFGGTGYYLSRKAADIVLLNDPKKDQLDDVWMSELLLPRGQDILISNISGYSRHFTKAAAPYNRFEWLKMMAEYHLEGKDPVRTKDLGNGRSFSYGLTRFDRELGPIG